ncbi:polymer-forming cytoskeletal protein [Hyphomonadaceae bacterium BL14]|nr:polymer-forming cytoskeletal protein [Hyphomonadaceae bacterium BL14]
MKSNKAPSILAQDIVIIGSIASAGEVQIDGRVEGDVRAGSLMIGQNAVVKGDIIADTLAVHGRIEGVVQARSVVLVPPASVQGEISYDTLTIQGGAVMDGVCRRGFDPAALDTPGSGSGGQLRTGRTGPDVPPLRPVLLGLQTRPKDGPGQTI